jgi:hypothetical protein
VFGLYVAATYLRFGDILNNPRIFAMSLFGLACIWIGDKKGGRRKIISGIQIYPPSSGFMLRFMGWVFLLLPFILFIVSKMNGNKSTTFIGYGRHFFLI